MAPHGPGQELPAGERWPQPGHFLYVGDAEPRKNLEVLLAAYAGYREAVARPLELVVAGTATTLSRPGVRVVGSPSALVLAELYLGAAALVHPSLYEGFGLTPLEAMSLGTPVLAARSPGLTEVCADAVLYADPSDPRSFTHAMVQVASDDHVRERLSERGRERAEVFSWAACARRHADAYDLALAA